MSSGGFRSEPLSIEVEITTEVPPLLTHRPPPLLIYRVIGSVTVLKYNVYLLFIEFLKTRLSLNKILLILSQVQDGHIQFQIQKYQH